MVHFYFNPRIEIAMINNRIQDVKKYISLILLIGLGFLWTGTAYIAQAYRLLSIFDGGTVNLITCGIYYVCQAVGIGVVSLFFFKRPVLAGGKMFPLCTTAFAVVCTAVSLYSFSLSVIVVFGALLNVGIGVLSGCYLTRLATDITQQRRGLVFGCAYVLQHRHMAYFAADRGRFLWHSGSFYVIAALRPDAAADYALAADRSM